MLISRRHHPPATPIPPILLDGKVLPLQPTVNILGVEVNSTLSFTSHPLQHRRDVAGLCVTYKILKQGAPHLAILRQPWATPHPYSTRDANKRDQQLIVPFARTATFFRSFLPRYSRLWNRVVRQTDMHQAATPTSSSVQ
ncbi:hypothetical protein GWK47_038127 [Chionoecetes opilio]|uniref:Uncharacterized protein n=1 Tax=Chionoecetes opilio TaxID=41210 RepID=A0A8J4YLD8_CHIOP|nr:hypothetical protein GWK47_038127 [Chionoecetes opilio]